MAEKAVDDWSYDQRSRAISQLRILAEAGDADAKPHKLLF